MYQRLPSWVLGFHGTDEETVLKIVSDPTASVEVSKNEYDWLGPGAYFWENDPTRAMRFSVERMKWRGIKDKKPAVIGAVIDLGHCMNLFDQPALDELKSAYDQLCADMTLLGAPLPENKGKSPDRVFRNLDKAVFDQVHRLRTISSTTQDAYQTVRSPFMEGDYLYDNTLFREKNHIQIAVIDPKCILGFFLPRK